MNRMMITATNTLSQLQKQMDIISNNMANIDTTGYKKRDATFTDLLYSEFKTQPQQDELNSNRLTPMGLRQGVGARLGQVQINMTQGNLKTTERPLDVAFTTPNQYFSVLVQDGANSSVQYTRDGAFSLSPVSENETMLVNSTGNPILDENNNPITFTGDVKNYKITANGQIIAEKADGTQQTANLGVIQINKPQFFEQKGNNLLGLAANFAGQGEGVAFTALNGALRNGIAVNQGVLEQSNVDMGREMTELINVQRSYQFQARSITLSDQMMGLVNQIR
ncbi:MULTISPECIES: flagellar hook-basal body protein [unclassified Bacillus (in: firmicutes)]|uniref:flagellar hook-basal body protein n=1 Tax=unclassified Bacillus (in: firmicutes) TaxID=185979 RepID=UPI0008F1E4F5|nr:MULTISPECIES: flagellar hook-basal body protein [unclassified Bacillus (in: firmicutes)]SFB04188.1 flagellar basal-body rod protein FlgG [Bacillus sp. UNCCL13]SFQ88561.1 flagellar basal-body rod protein FlgG [Bacillus sp. cl95]